MSYKTTRICDGCERELKKDKECFNLVLKSGDFIDGAGSRDFDPIAHDFCEHCAKDIINVLKRLVKKQ